LGHPARSHERDALGLERAVASVSTRGGSERQVSPSATESPQFPSGRAEILLAGHGRRQRGFKPDRSSNSARSTKQASSNYRDLLTHSGQRLGQMAAAFAKLVAMFCSLVRHHEDPGRIFFRPACFTDAAGSRALASCRFACIAPSLKRLHRQCDARIMTIHRYHKQEVQRIFYSLND
jgi:hypothetical protein